jgi:quercetin dioxygenase-like cupin family protein
MPSAVPASAGSAPIWSASGEGERLWFLGTLAVVRVPGEAVDGRFSLVEFVFRRNTSPSLHTHPQDESYVVLEGRLTVKAGSERFELGPGGAAVIPMGVPHTFRVDSDTARVLLISTPAGIERFVRDASVPAAAATLPPAGTPRPTPQEVDRIYRKHACIEVGPRLGPED